MSIKKRVPISKQTLFFVLLTCFSVFFLLFLLLKTTQAPQSKVSKQTALYLVNFDQSRKNLIELATTIQDSKKTGANITKAQDLLIKVLGDQRYGNDAPPSFSEITSRNTSPTWPLIPTAIQLATLCQQMEQRGDSSKQTQCANGLSALSDKIDLAERLVKYYAIMNNVPDLCVKADLDTKPHLKATAIDGTTDARLYLCTGAPGDIKFRAPAKNGKYVRVEETFTTDVTQKAEATAAICIYNSPLTIACNLTRN